MRKILTGLLCAFAAAAAEAETLPSGYRAVEYIESTPGGGQYIDTGYKPNSNTRVTMDIRVNGSNETWFGVWDSDYYRGAYCVANDGRFGGIYVGFGNEGQTLPWKDADNKTVPVTGNRVTVELDRGVATCAGVKCRAYSGQQFRLNNNLYLFAQNRVPDGKPYFEDDPITCYGCEIYEGNVLVRDFVPCVEMATGKAGLYDTISHKFFGNEGKGEDFKAPLPTIAPGYVPVGYIESTPGGGQYINTGYTPHKDTKVICRMLDMGTPQSWGAMFGSRLNIEWTRSMYMWLRRDGRIVPSYGRAGDECTLGESDFPFGEITTVTCQGATSRWVSNSGTKNNGIELTNCKEGQYEGFAPMLIFAINSAGTEGGCSPTDHLGFRLYSFQIFEGEKLERDFVPCVETETGKAGLYDTVYGKFYGNEGNGEDFRAKSPSLPFGYVSVDYIESTLNGGQYINTEYIHKKNSRVECVVNVAAEQKSGTGWMSVFGACKGGYANNAFSFFAQDANGNVRYNRSGIEKEGGKLPRGTLASIVCEGLTAKWTANGVTTLVAIPEGSATSDDGVCPLLIFDKNKASNAGVVVDGSRCVMKLYSFKIYEGNALVRDFVPCVATATGKAGLYDTVEGKFYGNAGGGDLRPSHRPVSYIESTADGRQYINTGYTHRQNTMIACSASVSSKQAQGYPVIFGSFNGNYQTNAFAFFAKYYPELYGSVDRPALCRTGYEQAGEPYSFPYDTRVDLVCKGTKASWSRFGETSVCGSINNFWGNADDGACPMNIFVNNNHDTQSGNTWCQMRLYSFKIFEDEVLKRDFVPCVETATGKAGLYDTVAGEFYGNAGGGDFMTDLPSGYLPVEYIESTAGGGQYINTGYTPHKDTKVVCRLLDMGTDSSKDYGAVFGSRKGYNQQRNMFLWLRRGGANEPSYGRAGTEVTLDNSTFPFGEIATVTCQGTTCSWVSDSGTKNNSITLTDYKTDQEEGYAPMLIFAVNSPDTEGGCNPTDCWGFRLYAFQIFEGTELKRDFVPCVATATGKAGLYDRVEGKFYGNAGTGDFLTGAQRVPYWDPVTKTEKVAVCETVTSATSTFEDGKWYAAMGSVTRGSIVVNGSANLILVDGCSLTSDGGIQVDNQMSFTVHGQRAGTGTLTANGGRTRAGIGGVNPNQWAHYGSCGDITINGGIVNAKGGEGYGLVQGAAGIGGGPDNKYCGKLTIHGGTVTAIGAYKATGIGGGSVYGGDDGNCGPIIIDGGAIDARPGKDARNAIGVEPGGRAESIAISGGIFASQTAPGWLASGYFCGVNMDPQTSAAYPWQVKEIIPVSVRFIRSPGVTALLYRTNNEGEFVPFPDEGMDILAGTLVELQVQLAPGFRYQGETKFQVDVFNVLETISADVQYVDENGETCFTDGLSLSQVDGSTTALNAGWYVVRGAVECGTITVNGAVHLVLVDGSSLTVNGGIRVESGRALTIYGQSEGTGKLNAIGASRCAGIGAGPSGNSGTVAIHGGSIDARAGDGAKEDIGAGGSGTAGPVTITGGFFARKPKEAWIADGHWISDNCQPGTFIDYSWKVMKFAWAPVRLAKSTGVDELEFHREDDDEFEPFPAGGTNLLVGAWVRIRVHSRPGYSYTGELWFYVDANGLNKTITSTAIGEEGDGSPGRPWLVGDFAIAWTNGTGGLSVSGEGPMDDCIDAYGPVWTAFADDITELTVEGDVTAIGAGAFAGLANLTNVTILADHLVSIGDYAFADCWSLIGMTLPDSLEEIGDSAFEYCLDLRSCDLPESLLAIGARAFFYCWTLTEIDIPDSVIAIGDQAFAGCSWLLRLGLGSDLIWLGDSAFSDCTSVQSIAIRAEEPPAVGDKVFYLVPTLATLTVPAASLNAYKMAKGWEDFDIQPAADSSKTANRTVVARPTLAARLASAAPGAVGDKPAFEVVREEGAVRVTVRLPKALPGVLYRLVGSADLTFANPTEVARGTAVGTGGLELSGTVPDGAECYFRVDTEGGNAQ